MNANNETPQASSADELRARSTAALREVIDPEIGINIVDLGLVYGIVVSPVGDVHVALTMTTAACPLGEHIVRDAERRLYDAALRATVELVWDPPWGPERMLPAARAALAGTSSAALPAAVAAARSSDQPAPTGTPRQELTLRRGLLLLVLAAALTAVLAGLARVGLVVGWGAARAMSHGPLFALGVFGTVIALERAVALGRSWSYLAALLGAAGALAQLAALPGAGVLAAASGCALVAVNVAIVRRQSAAFTWLMVLGSVVLAVGSTAWALGQPVFAVVPSWIAFFVLTIAAERLELSRLAVTPRWATGVIIALSLVVVVTALGALVERTIVPRLFGASLLAIALWQLTFDLARSTLRQPGLPRFAASGVLLGAGWLLVAGVLFILYGLPVVGPIYDALLHSVLVGFVLSMVFAHAPIILPAVAQIDVPYHRALYVPLVVLHLGLAGRVIGDLAGLFELRRATALANALALGLFALAVLWSRHAARATRKTAP